MIRVNSNPSVRLGYSVIPLFGTHQEQDRSTAIAEDGLHIPSLEQPLGVSHSQQ